MDQLSMGPQAMEIPFIIYLHAEFVNYTTNVFYYVLLSLSDWSKYYVYIIPSRWWNNISYFNIFFLQDFYESFFYINEIFNMLIYKEIIKKCCLKNNKKKLTIIKLFFCFCIQFLIEYEIINKTYNKETRIYYNSWFHLRFIDFIDNKTIETLSKISL